MMGIIWKLEVVSFVLVDIDVVNFVKLLYIFVIVEEFGLKFEEYDCYGKFKVKVLRWMIDVGLCFVFGVCVGFCVLFFFL